MRYASVANVGRLKWADLTTRAMRLGRLKFSRQRMDQFLTKRLRWEVTSMFDPLTLTHSIKSALSFLPRRKTQERIARSYYEVRDSERLEAARKEISDLEEKLHEAQRIIYEVSFPYDSQFTPKRLPIPIISSQYSQPQDIESMNDPRYSHPMFSVCKILVDNKAWDFDPEVTSFVFDDWFDLDVLRGVKGFPEMTQEWKTLFGEDIQCWRGKPGTGVSVKKGAHKYVLNMYPFVWIARIPLSRVADQTHHLPI